jgi:hypothetical protein
VRPRIFLAPRCGGSPRHCTSPSREGGREGGRGEGGGRGSGGKNN